MPHSKTFEALILKTYDIAEADRYCILLTREIGLIAARAKGVRKPTSRMGGTLLPLRHVAVTLVERTGGWLVSSAQTLSDPPSEHDLQGFLVAMQAADLLLALLHDEHPLPEIFEMTLAFFSSQNRKPNALAAFSLRTFALLGVLPPAKGLPALTPEERRFIDQCAVHGPVECNTPMPHLQKLIQDIVCEQTSRTMKSTEVAPRCA